MSDLRSGALIFRTSWLKNPAPPSAARSWRAASRSRVLGLPRRHCQRRRRRRVPLGPAVASSRRKSDSGGLRNVAPGPPPSPAPATPPRRSSPSPSHRSSVSFSCSSSAPFDVTERPRLQLVNRSQKRGPLHIIVFASTVADRLKDRDELESGFNPP